MPQLIRESTGTVSALARTGTGRVKLVLITPGKGSSGTYSAEVLKRAAEEKVFPRGTQSHVNHDTDFERAERPEGDLRNLAMVLTEDAYVDDDGALVAEAQVASAWRSLVEEFKDYIGASIVANAEIRDTKDGRVVERLLPGPFNRVDLVTVAGRGGRIAEVLEAARTIEARSIVSETTASDIDSYLRAAVRDTHRTQDDYAWMQDYDDENVYFEKRGRIYRQAYTLDGVNVVLEGEPAEVRRRVEYDPVTPTDPPAAPAGVTENQEEANMATIDDKELADLRESASRATTAEADITTATERAAVAEAGRSESNDVAAAALVTAALAEAGLNAPKTAARLSKGYPVKENGAIDVDAFTGEIAEAVAELSEASGAGQPRGLGDTKVQESATEPSDEDILTALKGGK